MEKSTTAQVSYGISDEMLKQMLAQNPDLKQLVFVVNINNDRNTNAIRPKVEICEESSNGKLTAVNQAHH